MTAACYLCGSRTLELPVPGGRQSVTTDGQILPIPWNKRQCGQCSLLQSADTGAIAATMFSYEENYQFYDRPFMHAFEDGRYDAYADWVGSVLDLRPNGRISVLEVGCGTGWVLERLMRRFPGNDYVGIEPSANACAAAHKAGVDVWHGSADAYRDAGRFDAVYSINVVEHTADPIALVATLATLVRGNGRVCVICPNGSVIDPEILFVDHLFSFTRDNLQMILAKAGVQSDQWLPGEGLLVQFQSLAGVKGVGASVYPTVQEDNSALRANRRYWLERWNTLDEVLCERMRSYGAVLCFGAGDMSDLLRAYATRTWSRMRGYVIDRPQRAPDEEAFFVHGLPLFILQDIDIRCWDAVLLGTRLPSQAALYHRLTHMGAQVIRWDDVISLEGEVAP